MTSGAAGSSGGACTAGYFGWPDSSGYPLQCVSSAWALAGDFSSSDYAGTSCAGSQYIQSLSAAGLATCATPAAYTNYSGSTANTVTADNLTVYLAVQGSMSPTITTDTAGVTRTVVSRAGTIQNLYVYASANNSNGKNNTYTIMKNGSAQTLTCTMNGSNSCSDTTHTFAVSAGDQIGMRIVTGTTTNTTQKDVLEPGAGLLMRKLIVLCLALFLMVLPGQARAQVTYDNSASSNCTVCSSLTYSLTVGSGSNRAMAVWVLLSVTFPSTQYPYVTGITYAGVSLIPIATRAFTDIGIGRAELWALPAGTQPTTGANNVVVTLSGTGTMDSMHSGAISVAGVDQTQTFTSVQTNSIKDTYSAYMTLPLSGANDLVFDGVCGAASVDSTSQTQRALNNVDSSTGCNNDGIATASGGTVYLSWAVNGSAPSPGDLAQMVGGSFHAAATATKLQLKNSKLQVIANTGTSTPAPTFQWVQAQTGSDGNNTSSVRTSAFSSNPATGDTIICVTTINQSGDAVTSITDTQGNTYVQATSVNDATNVQDLEL